MTLFDDRERTDKTPARHQEDSFTFLNRANGIVWSRIRDELDLWFADTPNSTPQTCAAGFGATYPGAHWSAWWELYLHRLFTCLGYEAVVHPDVPGTSHHPDFELTRANERLYLEAAVVFSGIQDDQRDGRREGWILDAVNRGSSENFYVLIEFEKVGAQRPKDREVYRPLETWLENLDPDQVAAEHAQTGSLPTKAFTIRDWVLRFEALPITPEARGSHGRLWGGGPVSGGLVNDREQLHNTLKDKRGRYGESEVPLVVAVNCASSFMDDNDIGGVLYGSKAVQYEVGVRESSRWVRLRDGTWRGEPAPRGQRMSAVFSTVQLHPWTAAKTVPRLWLNPWAKLSFAGPWPFTTWTCSDQGLVTSAEQSPNMAELLGLPHGWPGPENAFD
jgi:hypothetical protein